MNYYPFHPGDYIRDTAHLGQEEDLCYRRLLDLYYISEAPIPLETNRVSRRLRMGSDVVLQVLSEFFAKGEDGWHHTRCDAEIAAYKRKSDTAKANGKRGGRPKNKGTKPTGFSVGSYEKADGNPRKSGSKANQNQNQNQNKGIILPFQSERFQEAWSSWVEDRKARKKPITERAMKIQLSKLEEMGEKTAIEAIENSIANGYQGIFAPRPDFSKRANGHDFNQDIPPTVL